jgi:hypothetical protein|tara:strand:- start:105 stop:944 length:840 start_codon:yes stop_codon:yes gene_type:complete
MSSQEANTQKQFNPFNNEFECNICYEYCYGDKMDCKTCSGAICNECMKGLNKSDALRNKCVTCRSPLEYINQFEIVKIYRSNLAFFSLEKRRRIADITAFFRHEKEKNEIDVDELSWYFKNILPLHSEDGGIKRYDRGHRVVYQALFPKSKTAWFDTSKREWYNKMDMNNWAQTQFRVNNNHRILCYHIDSGLLAWTNKTAIISKRNSKSVKLVKGYNRPDDNLCQLAYNSIDSKKRYNKMYGNARFNPSKMLGADMGHSILIYQSSQHGFIYFINSLL